MAECQRECEDEIIGTILNEDSNEEGNADDDDIDYPVPNHPTYQEMTQVMRILTLYIQYYVDNTEEFSIHYKYEYLIKSLIVIRNQGKLLTILSSFKVLNSHKITKINKYTNYYIYVLRTSPQLYSIT